MTSNKFSVLSKTMLVKLEEVAEFFSGATPSKARAEFWSGNIPWVSAKDMKERCIYETEDNITQEGLENGSRLAPVKATLILTRGMTLLSDLPICGLGREVAFNQDVKAIVPSEKVDPAYLTYAILAAKPQLLNMVELAGHGTGRLPTDRLKSLEIPLPEMRRQCSIVHILGTLDKKIELNRRMNETLEAMARALFKSWFVDFDPVRAKAEDRDPGLPKEIADLFPDRFVDSELGEIPEGWKFESLSELININPTRSLCKGVEAPYLDMANMPTRGHSPDDVVNRVFGSGMRFMNGDTLVARITPCLENGKTAFVDFLKEGEVGWGSTEYIVLRPKPPIPEEFAYCLARSVEFRDFAIQSMTGSSGRQRVPAESLSHFYVVSAPKHVTGKFGSLIKPLFQRASKATRENRILAGLRDALLPKLISGELSIKVQKGGEEVTK